MAVPVSMAALFLLAGCGEEAIPTNYTASNRDAFLTACSQPLDDPRLLTEVCGCVYDRLEDELSFDEFVDLNQDLTIPETEEGDDAAPSISTVLPDEVNAIVADCFVEEADL